VDTSVYVEDAEGPLQRNRSLVERVMQEGTRNLERAGFTVKGHVSEGLPSAEILIFLEDNPHDLVLVGAGNKTWLGRVLQGSVSLHVLHSSPTSVLIVREAGHTSAAHARVLFADDGSTHAATARDAVAKLASPETCDLTVVSV
jgi:hypothetical protein